MGSRDPRRKGVSCPPGRLRPSRSEDPSGRQQARMPPPAREREPERASPHGLSATLATPTPGRGHPLADRSLRPRPRAGPPEAEVRRGGRACSAQTRRGAPRPGSTRRGPALPANSAAGGRGSSFLRSRSSWWFQVGGAAGHPLRGLSGRAPGVRGGAATREPRGRGRGAGRGAGTGVGSGARGHGAFSRRRAGSRRHAVDMQNDAGEFVDLYVPRKW